MIINDNDAYKFNFNSDSNNVSPKYNNNKVEINKECITKNSKILVNEIDTSPTYEKLKLDYNSDYLLNLTNNKIELKTNNSINNTTINNKNHMIKKSDTPFSFNKDENYWVQKRQALLNKLGNDSNLMNNNLDSSNNDTFNNIDNSIFNGILGYNLLDNEENSPSNVINTNRNKNHGLSNKRTTCVNFIHNKKEKNNNTDLNTYYSDIKSSYSSKQLKLVGLLFLVSWSLMLYLQKYLYRDHITYLFHINYDKKMLLDYNNIVINQTYNTSNSTIDDTIHARPQYNNIHHIETDKRYNLADINKLNLIPALLDNSENIRNNPNISIVHNAFYHYQNFFKGLIILFYSTYKIFIINRNFHLNARNIIKRNTNLSKTLRNSNLLLGPLQIAQMTKVGRLRQTITNRNMEIISSKVWDNNQTSINKQNRTTENTKYNLTSSISNNFILNASNNNKENKNNNNLAFTNIDSGSNQKISLFKIISMLGVIISLAMITNYLRMFYICVFISVFPLFYSLILNIMYNKSLEDINASSNIKEYKKINISNVLIIIVVLILLLIIFNPFVKSPINKDDKLGNTYIHNNDYLYGFIIGLLLCFSLSIRFMLSKYNFSSQPCNLNYLVELRVCSVVLIMFGFIQICYKKSLHGLFPVSTFALLVLLSLMFLLGIVCFFILLENVNINFISKFCIGFIIIGVLLSYSLIEYLETVDWISVSIILVIIIWINYFENNQEYSQNSKSKIKGNLILNNNDSSKYIQLVDKSNNNNI